MFWRSVLESYGWGLDLPDSRADVHACCYVYNSATRRFFRSPRDLVLVLLADCGR